MAVRAAQVAQSDLDIAGLVRYVRVELLMSQEEFGRLLGVHSVTVCRWENGHADPPRFKQYLVQAAAEAIARGGVDDLVGSLDTCGPAYALWRVLNKAYRVDP